MKNVNFSQTVATLLLAAATVAIAPSATAAESKAVDDIQKTRLAFLNSQSKAIDNIQKHRIEFLERQDKAVSDIQKHRLEHLNTQSKRVDNIQETRLEILSNSTKGVDDAWGDDFTGKTSRPTVGIQF